MKIQHPKLADLLQKAYSAEKAAAFAYQGDADSTIPKLLPFFEKLFSWGKKGGFNNVDPDKKYPVEKSDVYCKK